MGGTLTYTIWLVNCSPYFTGWNIVALDPLPVNVGYIGPSLANWTPPGSSLLARYSDTGVTWTTGEPANGQAAPQYLRWVVDKLGPGRSACVTFRASVL